MRAGFQVHSAAEGRAVFDLFYPDGMDSNQTFMVTFAKDPSTGAAAALIGKLYYKDELQSRLPDDLDHKRLSDAALALAIFRQQGPCGLNRLEGEFALALWDLKERCLYALRDPLGSYPLYWHQDVTGIRLGTGLLSLGRQLKSTSLDADFLASFLMFPYAFAELPAENTVFQGVQRIRPGHLVAFYPAGGIVNLRRWDWRNCTSVPREISLEAAGAEFAHLFRAAIRQRIQDGRIAAHLSGGMDSSSAVCIARRELACSRRQDKLATLSLVYQGAGLAEERRYIDKVVQQEPLEAIYVPGDDALSFQWFREDLPEHDEPYSGLFYLSAEKRLVEAAWQAGADTVLAGTGAELVAEGNRFHLADLVRRGRWRAALKEAQRWARADNEGLWPILHRYAIEPLCPPQWRGGIGPWLRRGYGRWPNLSLFSIPPWVSPSFAKAHALWRKGLDTARQISRYPAAQSFDRFALQTCSGYWASWHLAAPLGIRISRPFLDPRLIAYSLSLPREIKEIPGMPKPLLQAAMRGVLPEPIRTRRLKRSFNGIYWRGLAENLKPLESMVLQSKLGDLGLFDKSCLLEAMRQHALGIGDAMAGGRINSSLALIAWFDRYEQWLRAADKPTERHGISPAGVSSEAQRSCSIC